MADPKPIKKRRLKRPVKKAATKRRPKKPSAPKLRKQEDLPKTHVVRQQAMADYVTDPESRDELHHYGRADRSYEEFISIHVFRRWKQEDDWETHRSAYWTEAQRMLLEKTRDQTVQMLADSMKELNELRGFALEWCDPIRDTETGEVLRYPDEDDQGNPHRFAGKPMLSVRPRSYESAVAAALALDEAVRERRDEVLRLTGQGDSASKAPTDPVVTAHKLSPEDLRSMAQALTLRRQPELLTSVVDVEEDDG